MGEIVLFAAVVIAIYMSTWYVIALLFARNDIADIAWGLGFILVTWMLAVQFGSSPHLTIIRILTSIWGIRLAIHIYLRNRTKKEDYRYLTWRKEWGKWFYLRSYLQVFLLQGLFMLMISASAILATRTTGPVTIVNYFGVLLWAIGFFFETVGDYQLSQFIKNPKNRGHIMKYGLWSLTRHPNYFGEVTQWWGIFCIAVTLPLGFLAIISPVTITILILGISGIPMLEKKYIGNKEFEEYKKTTSAFFPYPRRLPIK